MENLTQELYIEKLHGIIENLLAADSVYHLRERLDQGYVDDEQAMRKAIEGLETWKP